MIKPDDIPNDLEEMCQAIEWFQCGDTDKPAIAAILNAAIEAGVVSPPCWAVRDGGGRIVTQRRVFTSKTLADEEFAHRRAYSIEHWKGQTE